MSMGLHVTSPWALVLLPLALLPLLLRRGDALEYAHLTWLPADLLGRWAGRAWRALAVLVVLADVLAIAGLEQAEGQVLRHGHGAEVMVLMDRSRSMDEHMLPADWRNVDPLSLRFQADSRGEQKSQVARELLAGFAASRAEDRFALMFFSVNPIYAVPFTQHQGFVQAAIAAGGIGRGLSDTDVGRALRAAIGEFEGRSYSGSRVILLVSDGGAELDEATQRDIRAGLLRNRIALNWLYLRSINGPDLDHPEGPADPRPEIVLHRYFQSLPTPYRAYQAESKEDLARAVADVGRQQNLPLEYFETVPRRDHSRGCLLIASLACLGMLGLRRVQLREWK